MNAHTRKTYEALTEGRAPRDLEWSKFLSLWEELADGVEQESQDRLVVIMNGHRTVFRRPHDGRVSLDDVDKARKLLADRPQPQGHGRLVVVAIDAKQARVVEFDLDAASVDASSRRVEDGEPDGRHLRTVEAHSGRDDTHDLTSYYDEVAGAVLPVSGNGPFVVLGHGAGKANVANGFVDRLRQHHKGLAHRLSGVGDVDLSSATDAKLLAAARDAIGRT